MNIGFFDSGLGGLTILRAVVRSLPQYEYVFYGDTANVPYGDKTEVEVYAYSQAAMEYLFARDCVLVILACNTASAKTLRRLQDEWLSKYYPDRRILGVIIPTIETLIESGSRRALLLATKRTVSSGKYNKELALRGDGHCQLTSYATPTLVPLIESGNIEKAVTEVEHLLQSISEPFDTLILGCTHYTELKAMLRNLPTLAGVRVISQDEIIPVKLEEYLLRHPEIANQLSSGGMRSIHLTSHRPEYDAIAAQLLHGAFVG